ncbi:hypothetical protein EAF04_006235 [Stromatinia cepivora]|nr:hypothetical protein EAF04_006235 [Stromatinia cepivora]
MTRIYLSNTWVFFLSSSIPHLIQASKPSIKTVTVNPCTLTPKTPTVVPPSPPCPTVTISTSHTSCPPTTPTSCSQNFCVSGAFITVPCTCPYSVPTTTLYTPCPSTCSQTCFTGHQIYHETSCSTTIDTYTTPTTTTTTATTTTTNNLVTCSCPYYPPYPTNCIFPCPVHTPTTVITVPTTITSAPSCESITITRGESCPPVVGGPCTSPDCIYLSTVTIKCGCGNSIGTVTSCKTTCDGACGTTWQTVALPCPTVPSGAGGGG